MLAAALLGLALVVDGTPFWGSDVGGVLAMVPAYAVAVIGLFGLRVRIRSLLIGIGAAVVAIVAFALVDLSRPHDSQTHLGRLVTSTRDGGWHSFAIVIERKLSANIDALWPSQWTVMVPIMVVLMAGVIALSPGHLRAASRAGPAPAPRPPRPRGPRSARIRAQRLGYPDTGGDVGCSHTGDGRHPLAARTVTTSRVGRL